MDFPTVINLNSLFLFQEILSGIFIFSQILIEHLQANSEDPDQMPHSSATLFAYVPQ